MQGTVLAELKCSISIDTIGKECLENQHQVLYSYKKYPPFSFVDDIIGVGVGNCGPDVIHVIHACQWHAK